MKAQPSDSSLTTLGIGLSPGDFDPEGMIALRDRIAAGEVVGPRILTAGPYFDGEIGTLEAGKEADIVIVEGDPSSDIMRMGNTVWVFADGVRHTPSTLRESARGKIGLPGENSP